MRERYLLALIICCGAAQTATLAQNDNSGDNANDSGGFTDFDACGTLVRSDDGCILFEGGGGQLVLSDYGSFGIGDAVRVVGTLDENCITICGSADGCVRGAVVYDPAVFPCGSLINVPFDPCAGLAGGLTLFSVVGLIVAAGGRRAKPTAPQ